MFAISGKITCFVVFVAHRNPVAPRIGASNDRANSPNRPFWLVHLINLLFPSSQLLSNDFLWQIVTCFCCTYDSMRERRTVARRIDRLGATTARPAGLTPQLATQHHFLATTVQLRLSEHKSPRCKYFGQFYLKQQVLVLAFVCCFFVLQWTRKSVNRTANIVEKVVDARYYLKSHVFLLQDGIWRFHECKGRRRSTWRGEMTVWPFELS